MMRTMATANTANPTTFEPRPSDLTIVILSGKSFRILWPHKRDQVWGNHYESVHQFERRAADG
jgi:hypothetical protein